MDRGIRRPGFAKHFAQAVCRAAHRRGEYTLILLSVSLPLALAGWRRRVQSKLWCINCSFLVFDSFPACPSLSPNFPLPLRAWFLHRTGKGVSASIYHFRFSLPHGQSFSNTFDLFSFFVFSIYSFSLRYSFLKLGKRLCYISHVFFRNLWIL